VQEVWDVERWDREEAEAYKGGISSKGLWWAFGAQSYWRNVGFGVEFLGVQESWNIYTLPTSHWLELLLGRLTSWHYCPK
jgi:hypothetical protein